MINESYLSFNKDQFSRLFPFHLLVDSEKRIISFGSSVRRIFPITEGDDFFRVFSIKQFTIRTNVITSLQELQGQVVILHHRSDVHIILRGEFTAIGENKDQLLFVGAPWFGSMEELIARDLTVNDFAHNDPKDLLHLKTQEITTNEIKELLAKVNRQSEALKSDKEELKRRENMLTAIANATDVLLSNTNVTQAVSNCLTIIGKAADVDRSYLFQNDVNSGDDISISLQFEWNVKGAAYHVAEDQYQHISLAYYPELLKALRDKEPFISLVDELDDDAPLKAVLQEQQIQSVLVIPIYQMDCFWGFVGFDDRRSKRVWSEADIALLKSFCFSISNALERNNAVRELQSMAMFAAQNPDPVIRIDMTGEVLLKNSAAQELEELVIDGAVYSQREFYELLIQRITSETPSYNCEVGHEGKIYLMTARSSGSEQHINIYGNDITQQKKTEKELARLSVVASANRNGVLLLDCHGRVSWCNDALTEITGFSSREIIGKNPLEVFRGLLTSVDETLKLISSFRNERQGEFELVIYRKNKSWLWVNIKTQPLQNADKTLVESFAIFEDITEKKIADELLKESEKRLSTLIANLQTGILLEDENRKIVVTNPMFCEIFRIPVAAESMIGMDSIVSPERIEGLFPDAKNFAARIDALIHGKEIVINEHLEMLDGRVIERTFIPIFVHNQYKGHLWKFNDITERRKYEVNLKAQEEKYRRIIENMDLGLIEVNPQDEIEYANQSFCDLSGYSLDELLFRKAAESFTSTEDQLFIRQKNELRKNGAADSYEVQVLNKAGEKRWWLISGAPNVNDKGEFVGTIGIHLDITQQKRLEEQLREAKIKAEESSRAKESFLANMSHEIRTPLNAIIGMVRELTHTKLDKPQASYVSHARTASQHLLSIVNNILDISKIEAGQLTIDSRPFSLYDVLKETEAIMAPAAKEKMLTFLLQFHADTKTLYSGDPNRLRQIFINIISNAIKFTETGRVIVDCASVGDFTEEESLLITITDTGIGMDPSFLENLFKKFTQENSSITRHYGGTGLGMAITRELLQLMEGSIEVQSTKGSGTQIKVTLTFKKEFVSHENRLPLNRSDYARRIHPKILLVEDSALNRLVANNSLRRHGIKVVDVQNGEEAIEKLRNEKFDLVLMDMQMPVMDGIEATKFIRTQLNLDVPIIAFTANVFRSEIEKCIEAGMNDFVVKPFEEKLLLNTIYKNLERTEFRSLIDAKAELDRNENL